MATPTFRADIEGLRALAVTLVIFYHFQFPGVPGGFVGVDVFFVISGFFITQLLVRSLRRGTFRFSEFYARRIRRLVPLFLLVSTATFLMISPFYIGDAYYIFAKSWIASLLGLSNFYFFDEFSQYFAPASQSMPLLHTWSLAVEEQFYLLWPAALWLTSRWRNSVGAMAFAAFWVAAFALSIYMAEAHAKAAYYLLPARLFEFMLGTGVALYVDRLPRPSRGIAEALSLTGLTLILATALLLSGDNHFPGYNALWPTLGTALVIYAGCAHPETLAARVLSTPPMVFLGGISYSLYLWHWPPVALFHYQLIDLDWTNRIALFAGVILLSWLSFRYIENRYRHRAWSLKKSFFIFIFSPLLVIWAIQSTIRIADDLSFRIPKERRELYQIIAQNNPADLYKSCFKGAPYAFDQSQACLFGADTGGQAPSSVLIGDSHAIAQIGFVEQLLKGTDHSLLLVTRASTPFLIERHAREAFKDEDKVARSQALMAYLGDRPMTVFVSAWWNAYLRKPEYQTYFLDTLAWLLEQDHEVILLEDVPELPSAAYASCLLKNMSDCSIDAAAVNQRFAAFFRFRSQVEQRFPQVQWINPRKVICDDSRCQTVLNDIPLYRDESHLNNVGAREIGRVYLNRFGNPPVTPAQTSRKEEALH